MAYTYEDVHDDDTMLVNEPLGAYGGAVRRTEASLEVASRGCEIEDLPSDVLRMAVGCALDDIKNGRVVPADKIMDALHKRLGWK